MTEEYLLSKGYAKISDNEFLKTDKKTGMKVRLKFNPHGSEEENKKIEENVIRLLTRQDI